MSTGLSGQELITFEKVISLLPVDKDVIFSDFKNIYKKSVEKRQIKLLKKILFIKNFLDDDEKIYLVTTGCSPVSVVEQLTIGWIFIYLKRSLLVFTNKRIFHIPTKQDYSYRNSIAKIMYADCNSIKMTGRTLFVEYKNGKKERFYYIAGRERKKIKALLPSLSFEGEPSKSQVRIHLCPRCRNELEKGQYLCANCYLEFKNKEEARKISIIFPGGGYFYTRHPWLGISDAIVETFLIIGLIVSLVQLINDVPGSAINLVSYAVILIVEKLITIYHSNNFANEYIPKEMKIEAHT